MKTADVQERGVVCRERRGAGYPTDDKSLHTPVLGLSFGTPALNTWCVFTRSVKEIAPFRKPWFEPLITHQTNQNTQHPPNITMNKSKLQELNL